MNEKGSSLLVVLLIALIFSVLGLAVLGAAVNNVKRTEIREAEIETTSTEKVLLGEVLARLQSDLDNNTTISGEDGWLNKQETPDPTYDTILDTTIKNTECYFNNKLGFSCDQSNDERPVIINQLGLDTKSQYADYIDLSKVSLSDFTKENYMRIYEIKIHYAGANSDNPGAKRTITENIIVSPTPSFLNYAVGAYGKSGLNDSIQIGDIIGVDDAGNDILRESGNALIINGSPDIIGNVFAPSLELNSRAMYKDTNKSEDPFKTGSFQGPSIFGTLYTSGVDNKRKTEIGIEENLKKPFFDGIYKEVSDGITGVPVIKGIGSNFVDMDFDSTFNLKWKESASPTLDINTMPMFSDLTCNDTLYQALINTDGLVENHDPSGTTGEINIPGYDPFDDLMEIAESDEAIRSSDSSNNRSNNPIFYCGQKDEKQIYLLEESMLETYKGHTANLFDNYMDSDTDNIASKLIFFTNIDKDSSYNHIFKNDHTLTINKNLDLKDETTQKKGWLVVNGSLEINGADTEEAAPIIKGNILVNGDLFIRSEDAEKDDAPKQYVKFDATIYVTGNSTIDNVNISGAKDDPEDEDEPEKQLVLISNGDLKIVRINEYEDVENDDNELYKVINQEPNLKAFFYTNKNATLYGVGSNFQIEGGIFAREQLTINAIRYNFSSQDKGSIDEISSSTDYNNPNAISRRSRFYVEYDNKVITDQLSSLPRVNRLQVIVDNLIIN